jgi:hypothetical protein
MNFGAFASLLRMRMLLLTEQQQHAIAHIFL